MRSAYARKIRNILNKDIIMIAFLLFVTVLYLLILLGNIVLSKQLSDARSQIAFLKTWLAEYDLQITELEPAPIPTPEIKVDVAPLESDLTITPGAQRIIFVYFIIMTTSEPVHITTVEVVRDGRSTDADIAEIRLYEGDVPYQHQIGFAKELDSSTHSATFSNLDVAISPYSIKTFSVKADISPEAAVGGSVRLSVSSIEKTGGPVLNLPFRGFNILIGVSSNPDLRLRTIPKPFYFLKIYGRIS